MSTWFVTYGYGLVHPNLLMGAYPLDEDDVERLALMRVERVLNLVEDSEYESGARKRVTAALARTGIREQRMCLVDYGRLPVDRLDEAVTTVTGWLTDGLRVYVHCRAGWQRSASVAAATVAVIDQIPIAQALRQVKECKPSADPLPHQRADLDEWWAHRSAVTRPARLSG